MDPGRSPEGYLATPVSADKAPGIAQQGGPERLQMPGKN